MEKVKKKVNYLKEKKRRFSKTEEEAEYSCLMRESKY